MELPEFLTLDRYGVMHLTGHRVGLRHLVELYGDGGTPELILAQFPTLSLALIFKVIAFYLENRAEIDLSIRKSRELVERRAAAPQPGPDAAELKRRMEASRPKESA